MQILVHNGKTVDHQRLNTCATDKYLTKIIKGWTIKKKKFNMKA